MARSQRSAKLENRTNRLRLAQGAREWLTIAKGLALAYRRAERGYGTWQARVWDGSKYHYRNLGRADDHQDANGADVLDFYQAQGEARTFYELATKGAPADTEDMTVGQAADRYLVWFRQHRKGVDMAESAVRAHIRPAFAERKLADLTAPMLRTWLDKIAAQPARVRSGRLAKRLNFRGGAQTADAKRARRASANRILSVLKAILNRAFQDGTVADDTAWRRVKPFAKADDARVRFLTDVESLRLANASPPDLRILVRAALLTGARWGELAGLRAADVNTTDCRIYIAESKSGRPRHIPLNTEGCALFKTLVTGKTGEDLVFTRSGGGAWGTNHHQRPLAEACKAAKIRPAVSFHELRHTYASHLAQAGVDLLTISKLLGHADTRITARHYAHLADKTLAAAVTKLPSFGRIPTENVRGIRG